MYDGDLKNATNIKDGGQNKRNKHPWLIHVTVWQKPLQYCKVISLQLIKINENKKQTNKKNQKKQTNKKRRWSEKLEIEQGAEKT